MLGMIAGFGWLGMGFMGLSMLLPLGLIVGALWLGGHAWRRDRDEAAAILRRRLASGEIDPEQYHQARQALRLRDVP